MDYDPFHDISHSPCNSQAAAANWLWSVGLSVFDSVNIDHDFHHKGPVHSHWTKYILDGILFISDKKEFLNELNIDLRKSHLSMKCVKGTESRTITMHSSTLKAISLLCEIHFYSRPAI